MFDRYIAEHLGRTNSEYVLFNQTFVDNTEMEIIEKYHTHIRDWYILQYTIVSEVLVKLNMYFSTIFLLNNSKVIESK
jgi:hypothetical protein